MAELLSALLPALLKKAGESLSTEFSFIGGIEHRRSELHTLLLAINQVIYDAEEQASKKPAVKSWIAKLKLAACDADDALDELHYEALRSEALRRGHKVNSGVRAFFSSHYNPLFFKYRIGKRLQQIVEQIDKLVSQMKQFEFLNCPMPVDERMQTYSYVDEQEVIGRDKERDEIVHMLLSAKSDELLILPIVGIGGLGKTTFAQLVFNDVKVKAHFQKHMWVCVPENFSVPDIVKRIIDTTIGNDCGLKSDNLELLQQRLREELSQKRYLLVLDDVWNEDKQKWEALRTLLGSCGMGSAVVVTTRNLKVASIMGTVNSLCLEKLSPEDSWVVFSRRAFGAGVVETPELVEVGKRIVQKCCGLPLAIKSMGALMSTKQETRDWLSILDSNTWDEESQTLPALSLSYKNLPSHMKQCFAFCAVFPKDYDINKDILIHLWISNGFIQCKETSDIEEDGNRVFWELVWRSFFQNVKQIGSKNEYGQKDVTTCKIHDLMHDLAVHISGDECFALENPAEIKKIPKTVHHLAFMAKPKISFVMQHCRVIRSIFHFGRRYFHQDIIFKESTFRVVVLRKCWFNWKFFNAGIEKFPIEPAFMKHLRYLDLSQSHIKTLPEAISALYNLQVLMLNGCVYLTHLPDGMKFMTSLRHVYLDNCSRLQSMPPGLGQLTNLRTLTRFILGNESGCGIHELKDLKLGGKLQIINLNEVTNPIEAKEANLEHKTNLQQLALCWGTSKYYHGHAEDSQLYRPEEVLDALKPPNGLTVLKLRQYMGTKFPIWMENGVTLHNIVKLSLTDSINCMELPLLWQLPFLEVLRLKGMKKLKYLCNGYSSDKECDHQLLAFPKLKLLSLEQMETLENWQELDVEQVTPANFPVLDAMEIIDCPKLTTMPNAPVLKSLSVIGNKTLIDLSSCINNLSYLCLGASQGSLRRARTLSYYYNRNLNRATDSKEHILAHHFSSWGSLTKLHLQGFNTVAPEDIHNRSGHVMSVQNLYLISCDCFIQYDTLQSPLWFWKSFACLKYLKIESCDSLTFWPGEEFQSLTSLKRLVIGDCKNFTGMPPAQLSVKSSEDEGMHNLEDLQIESCSNLVAFPASLSRLRYLSIRSCNVLEGLPEGLDSLGTLRHLSIGDSNPRLKSLPTSIQCLSNLIVLDLRYNDSLTLPEGMQNLTALNDVVIWCCPGIKALPEGLQQRLHSLERFHIGYCPSLERRCKRGGDYWSKVKDIPDLRVTGEQHSAWGDAARAVIPTCSNSWYKRASSSRQPHN